MATMCERRWAFIHPIIEAMVVVLPVPVGPVTRTRPRGSAARVSTAGGKWSSSKLGMSERTRRMARLTFPRCLNTFTRNRPTPGRVYPTSASFEDLNSKAFASVRSSSAAVSVSVAVSGGKGACSR
jgi:hypothetical protein